jgi:RimJ/RimL family protein N-acetyltransferase
MAEAWISGHPANFQERRAATYGIVTKADAALIGVIGLGFTLPFRRAELGYWIGQSFWNLGYATEAGHAIVAFAFGRLALHKLEATHLERNPASGRVLQKLGFQREGSRRDHFLKWERFENIAIYGLVSSSA